MNIKHLTAVAVLLAMTGAAWAGAGKVMVLAHEDDGERVEVKLDSEAMGFWLDELVDGETRSIVTEAGQNVSLTRKGDTVQLDVDGAAFEVPLRHDVDVQTHVLTGDHSDTSHADHDILIVMPGDVDESKKQLIIDSLRAAGIDDDVRFIETGQGQVRVVKKRIHK